MLLLIQTGWVGRKDRKSFIEKVLWELGKNYAVTITLQYDSPTFLKEMP